MNGDRCRVGLWTAVTFVMGLAAVVQAEEPYVTAVLPFESSGKQLEGRGSEQ